MGEILTGLGVDDAVSALIGGAALIALVGFTKWGAKKVAGMFG